MPPASVTQLQRAVEHDRLARDRFGRYDSDRTIGVVADGDWHRSTVSWGELALFNAFQSHFVEGLSWVETGFPTLVVDEGDWTRRWPGSRWAHCDSIDDVLDRLRAYDDLYTTIEAVGYRRSPVIDELMLNIGPDGELIHNNATSHRLAIAKLLGLESIPARALIRHRDWQHRRLELRDGQVSMDASHPNLAGLRPHGNK